MRELALIFLRLGLTAFGGPAAHLSMMENEFVRRRQWLTHQEFLDLVSAASLLPGPSSSEVAIYIGQKRAGWRGLILAGVCFILPAALIVTLIAWGYQRFHALPAVGGMLYGIKPVIVAVIFHAVWSLGRTAVKSKLTAMIGGAAAMAAIWGTSIPLILLASGLIALISLTGFPKRAATSLLATAAAASFAKQSRAAEVLNLLTPVSTEKIFLFFLKVGSIQFGSGYVLLAFLQADLVDHWRWLTQAQLLDATAVGQFTPGPVFTTATFIGYLLQGITGAVVATVGIFLPAFILVSISGPLIPRLRKSVRAGAFLDGVNVASLALMAVVAWQLARSSVFDATTAALGVIALFLLLRFKINSAWLILGGALIGFVSQR